MAGGGFVLGGALAGIGKGISAVAEESGKEMRERARLEFAANIARSNADTAYQRSQADAELANTRARENYGYEQEIKLKAEKEKDAYEGGPEDRAAKRELTRAQAQFTQSRAGAQSSKRDVAGYYNPDSGAYSPDGLDDQGNPDPAFVPLTQAGVDRLPQTRAKISADSGGDDDGMGAMLIDSKNEMMAKSMAEADVSAAAGWWATDEDLAGMSRQQAKMRRQAEIKGAMSRGETPPPFDVRRLAGQSAGASPAKTPVQSKSAPAPQDNPPAEYPDAKRSAKDGKWYVRRNGKFYEVTN